jgi:hypothetical protein
MSVKINASTTSGLVVDSDLTGSLKLQTAGNDALTVDSSQVVNFTKQFQIGGVLPPAFSAYATSNQSISSATFTKITFDTEVFDTNSNFASSRFTPTVAGYYQVNGNMRCGGTSKSVSVVAIYKNGSSYGYGNQINGTGAVQLVVSEVVYLNGSTDYVELYGYVDATTPTFEYATTAANCRFSASLVRGA